MPQSIVSWLLRSKVNNGLQCANLKKKPGEPEMEKKLFVA